MLPIKKINDNAIIPKRTSPTDAGIDLVCAEDVVVEPGHRHLFKLGWALAVPQGYYGRIAPRSGLAYKGGIDVMAGVIDSDYRGEVGVILINHGFLPAKFKRGDRIAQLIIEKIKILEVEEVDDLDNTDRGQNGFGSTGR